MCAYYNTINLLDKNSVRIIFLDFKRLLGLKIIFTTLLNYIFFIGYLIGDYPRVRWRRWCSAICRTNRVPAAHVLGWNLIRVSRNQTFYDINQLNKMITLKLFGLTSDEQLNYYKNKTVTIRGLDLVDCRFYRIG